jgi:hypothetical protein
VGFADGWEVGGDVGAAVTGCPVGGEVGAAVTGCPVGGDVGAAVTGVGTTQILSSYDKPDPNDEQVKGSNQPMSFHVGLTDSTSPAQAYERIF